MRYLAVLLLLFACSKKKSVVVNWENGKAISITVSGSVKVYLKDSDYPVAGDLDDGVFVPAVPFQAGQQYVVISQYDTSFFSIPPDASAAVPALMAIYPSCDTVPSNLLKIYLKFSEPMQESRSSRFVALFDDVSNDTIRDAFLDLKPELWNADGTTLTLWIDPGRVKQDLIPNKQLGTVLHDNHRYRLVVAKGWKSRRGVETTSNYSRPFITTSRDVNKPDIRSWTIQPGRDTIIVDTNETLDWSLLSSSVAVWQQDQQLEAKSFSEVCERQLMIVPKKSLERGIYTLKIDAILEDPAGNNLNRLFETDVTGNSDKVVNKDIYALTFKVN